MALNKEIEDQFSSAVKSALDTPGPFTAPAGTIRSPIPAQPIGTDRPRRGRAWAVALLCVAFAAIAVVVVVAIMRVRKSSVQTAAVRPGDTADQIIPTAVAPASGAAVKSTGATALASAIATPSSPAAESTAVVSNLTTAATASAPPVAISTTPRSLPVIPSNLAPAHGVQVSRRPRGWADTSGKSSPSVQTPREAFAAALAYARSLESGWPNRSPKAQTATAAPVSATVAAPSIRATVERASTPPAALLTARSLLVASPDHTVYWALEDSGTIFRWTVHRGWQQQGSGVRSDLLAGQAPSTTVCWVVGRHGTILLTTDGTRWRQIKSPTRADIIGVSALSADVADIVIADGSHLSTIDRGGYWMPTI